MGVKNGQNFADVFYVWPHMSSTKTCQVSKTKPTRSSWYYSNIWPTLFLLRMYILIIVCMDNTSRHNTNFTSKFKQKCESCNGSSYTPRNVVICNWCDKPCHKSVLRDSLGVWRAVNRWCLALGDFDRGILTGGFWPGEFWLGGFWPEGISIYHRFRQGSAQG